MGFGVLPVVTLLVTLLGDSWCQLLQVVVLGLTTNSIGKNRSGYFNEMSTIGFIFDFMCVLYGINSLVAVYFHWAYSIR